VIVILGVIVIVIVILDVIVIVISGVGRELTACNPQHRMRCTPPTQIRKHIEPPASCG
jgi:hypothetical protein